MDEDSLIHVVGGLSFRQMQQATRRIKATVSKCAMAPLAKALFQSPYLSTTSMMSSYHNPPPSISPSGIGMDMSSSHPTTTNHTSKSKKYGKEIDNGLSRALIRDLLEGHRFSESSSAM